LAVGEPTIHDLRKHRTEPGEIILFALTVPKRLLIKITEQVEWGNARSQRPRRAPPRGRARKAAHPHSPMSFPGKVTSGKRAAAERKVRVPLRYLLSMNGQFVCELVLTLTLCL
jgi:hypothetical protein